jgi:hypothetical protein
MKKQLSLGLITLMLAQLPVLPSQAELCEGHLCEVTFQYSGQLVEWDVPPGVSEIDFEIAGASGGRGGLGGKTTGKLVNLPSTLHLAVGGSGVTGSQVPGGFNGGGQSGGYRSNEGSGGGASDIRFGTELSDRVVVAGGGGGAGGYSGAGGGAGGGLQAANGENGQGGGGNGGNQNQGGVAGRSNGGSAATSGAFGSGGVGGSAINAGGGGGGGGWYGGGGGGADQDNCCMDGGGGGGGSSYAKPASTQTVVHQSGVNAGHGYIRLSYRKNQELKSFTASQVGQQIVFELDLLLPQALGVSDFDLSQLSCETIEFRDMGIKQIATASGCLSGFQQLGIPQSKIGAEGATGLRTANVTFDGLAPVLSWELIEQNHLERTATIAYSLSESALEDQMLSHTGCSAISIETDFLVLSDCTEQFVELSISAGSISDRFGNMGPLESKVIAIQFDFVVPDIHLQSLSTDRESGAHQVLLELSEVALVDVEQIELRGPEGCAPSIVADALMVSLSGVCGPGDYRYLFPVGSLQDVAGNPGPSEQFVLEFSIESPPNEEVVELPSEELPPVVPGPESGSDELPTPDSEDVPVSDDESLEAGDDVPVSEAPTNDVPGETIQPEVAPGDSEESTETPQGSTESETEGNGQTEDPDLDKESRDSRAAPEPIPVGLAPSQPEKLKVLEIEDKVPSRSAENEIWQPVRELTAAEKVVTKVQASDLLAETALAKTASDILPTTTESRNVTWLFLAGILLLGFATLLAWRVTGR